MAKAPKIKSKQPRRPHHIPEWADRKQLTQADLARRLGADKSIVSRWYAGASPSVEWQERLAAFFETEREALFRPPHEGLPRLVPIVGYVGAGAAAHLYSEGQGPFEHVPTPDGSSENTVAVEIRGESLGSFFDQWLVFYDDVRDPVTSDLMGKLCVCGLADGRILVKKMKRGGVPGTYTLLSQFEEPIYDAFVDWAAKVKTMVAR